MTMISITGTSMVMAATAWHVKGAPSSPKRNTFYWHFYLSQTGDLVKEATINAFFCNLFTYWI